MKKKIIYFLLLVTTTLSSQNFEGKIVYKNICRSGNPEWKIEFCQMITDSLKIFYFKDGNYKYEVPSSNKWTLYNRNDNKIYTKVEKKEEVYFTNANKYDDTILDIKSNKKAIKILGYVCDELIIKCKNSVQKYYFSSITSINYKLLENHKNANLNKILSITKAIPLKTIFIIKDENLELESIATEIKKYKVENDKFETPKKLHIVEGNY